MIKFQYLLQIPWLYFKSNSSQSSCLTSQTCLLHFSLSHLHCLFHSLVFHPLQSRDDGWHQFGTPLYLTWWSRGWAGQDHVGAKDHSNPMCCTNCLLSSTWLSPLILPLWKQFTFSCSLILPEAFMCLWCLHPLEVEKHWSESSYEGDLFPQIFINNGWK